MGNWVLYRDNQQYGPYTPEQILSFEVQGLLSINDIFYDYDSNQWLPLAQARVLWQSPSELGRIPSNLVFLTQNPIQNGSNIFTPPQQNNQQPIDNVKSVSDQNAQAVSNQPLKSKRKRLGCGCLGFIAILLIAVGITTFFLLNRISDKLAIGGWQNATEETINSSGGIIEIHNAGSPVDGMKINIPKGSYDKDTRFKISYRPIQSHAFGAKFNPITPLITIDNGHVFSKQPITVTIPIDIAKDEFAMGFYYNTKTGVLEGIPIAALNNKQLTLITDHFSDLVVPKIKKSELAKIDVNTGFLPGIDDWEFPNCGSWLAPGGHCAGQSISAMWYYYEKYRQAGERRLYGRFDNNNYGCGTIDFWQDDSFGYRFASMVHNKVDWDARSRTIFNVSGSISDNLTLDAFIYSMVLTQEPQYVAIGHYYKDKKGKTIRGGHAIIAYRVSGDKIYVADPNYPGMAGRYIQFSANSFKPYSSGENSTDIKAKGTVAYPEIRYMAKSALVDWDQIGALYQQLLNGTIGNDTFPKLSLKILKKYDPVTGASEWEDCPDLIKTDAATTAKVSENYRGKLVIAVQSGYSNQYSTLYKGLDRVLRIKGPEKSNPNGSVVFTINLEKGINDLGFLTEFADKNQDLDYTDFKRIKVLYEQKSELDFEKSGYNTLALRKAVFMAKAVDALEDVKYTWDFGDGLDAPETDKPETTHIYQKEGSYTATVNMVSKKENTVLATAKAPVKVVNLYGVWKLDYTIKEAGVIDNILNMILKVIVRFINKIVPTGKNPDDIKVSIEGTVIGCEMTVNPPPADYPSGDITLQLKQLTSSTDFVSPSSEIWNGIMNLNEDRVTIKFTGAAGSGNTLMPGITYKGVLSGNGINGTFDAGVWSGSFSASKK